MTWLVTLVPGAVAVDDREPACGCLTSEPKCFGDGGVVLDGGVVGDAVAPGGGTGAGLAGAGGVVDVVADQRAGATADPGVGPGGGHGVGAVQDPGVALAIGGGHREGLLAQGGGVETWSNVDVVDVARRLDLPTLILHARGDLRAPFEAALELGTLIGGSRVIPLDSANHLLRADEPAWARLLAEIDAFLAADGA